MFISFREIFFAFLFRGGGGGSGGERLRTDPLVSKRGIHPTDELTVPLCYQQANTTGGDRGVGEDGAAEQSLHVRLGVSRGAPREESAEAGAGTIPTESTWALPGERVWPGLLLVLLHLSLSLFSKHC